MNLGLILASAAAVSAMAASSLEFIEPADRAVFGTAEEIPLSLRAQTPAGVVASAEVFANGLSVGVATYCCPLCPCFHPLPGMELVLQLPAPWNGEPLGSPWQGLKGLAPGTYRLTAKATSDDGIQLEAPAVTIDVLPTDIPNLHLMIQADAGGRVVFVLPHGSLVPGGFDLWLSHDLVSWQRLGAFEAGNVAAFFSDQPDPTDARPRFYQSRRATQAVQTTIFP